MGKARVLTWLTVAVAAIAAVVYTRSITPETSLPSSASPVKVDLITGGPDNFWQIVAAGARESAREFNVNLQIHEPDGTGENQTEVLTALKPESTDGVAISPLAPADQARLISLLAAKTKVLTFDNDAPRSTRLCYIGTNNWSAGQLCADLVREALPTGGKIAIFVGDYERDNARHRRQAFLAALEGMRPNQGAEHPDLNKPITIGDYTVVRTYLDGSNPENAVKNVATALEEHPDLNGLVGLYGYNGPACLQALKDVGKLDEIKVVAFDEHEGTLNGIAEGHVHGSVVQEPFAYGYETVRLLAELNRRPVSSAPYGGSGTVYLPCEIVKQDNLEAFKAKLARRLKDNAPSKK